MLRPFTKPSENDYEDTTTAINGLTCAGQKPKSCSEAAVCLLEQWSRPEAATEYGWKSLLGYDGANGFLKCLLRSRSLLKVVFAVVLAQWLGLTGALFYMEKLLSLTCKRISDDAIESLFVCLELSYFLAFQLMPPTCHLRMPSCA